MRNLRLIGRDWIEFLDWDFLEAVQRRGAHVNTPKLGSRDGEISFGGISRIHAVLRRK
jgi:hypothetical protein